MDEHAQIKDEGAVLLVSKKSESGTGAYTVLEGVEIPLICIVWEGYLGSLPPMAAGTMHIFAQLCFTITFLEPV